MPKQGRYSVPHQTTPSAPYNTSATNSQRNAAIWSSTDDEILLQARASGLNWQPIASRHFPNKTANACRKRHERLIERRHVDDWDTHKLELLAQEYMACRREMWEVLASRLGERWAVVEAKVSLACRVHLLAAASDCLIVHGEGSENTADGITHSTKKGYGGLSVLRRSRYFRPS